MIDQIILNRISFLQQKTIGSIVGIEWVNLRRQYIYNLTRPYNVRLDRGESSDSGRHVDGGALLAERNSREWRRYC